MVDKFIAVTMNLFSQFPARPCRSHEVIMLPFAAMPL